MVRPLEADMCTGKAEIDSRGSESFAEEGATSPTAQKRTNIYKFVSWLF
jgi:hypothetical protein